MDSIVPYLIAGVVVIGVIALVVGISSKKKGYSSGADGSGKGGKKRSQAQIIRDANKYLAKDPHDPNGLLPMSEIYFNGQLWDKAFPILDELVRLATENSQINTFTVTLRHGICAVNLGKIQEAINSLSVAYKINPMSYEVNYYLGLACYKINQYEKAIPCFKKALVANPEAEGVYMMLGQSLYKSRHFKESLPCFKKALDEDPSNKEALFSMADAMNESGNSDKAIKVFMHLRPDPVYGPQSCLNAGLFHYRQHNTAAAITDYEIGLKHENIAPELKVELQYNLARCYFETNQIALGLNLLKQIRNVNPSYKDVNALIGRYQELSQNSNLQIYLSSNSSDFVTLCRKFIATKYKGSTIKIQSIDVDPMYTDILAEVYTSKWEDVAMFRFFRTSGTTGEMYVREFHSHMSDVKASRGFCISAGTFSEESHKYIEGRPIDLIEKNDLTKVLKQITM